MGFNNSNLDNGLNNNNNNNNNNDNSPNFGPKLALWGTVISTFGDAIQAIGGAIAIEESNLADQQQQQELKNLQNQIDDLKKAQDQNNSSTPDMDKLNQLLEIVINRIDGTDEPKNSSNLKKN